MVFGAGSTSLVWAAIATFFTELLFCYGVSTIIPYSELSPLGIPLSLAPPIGCMGDPGKHLNQQISKSANQQISARIEPFCHESALKGTPGLDTQ